MEKCLVDREDRETLGAVVGIAFGALGALWFVSWLFHLGPEGPSAPWWAAAYYLTAIGAALFAWALVAAALYLIVQRLPLSASGEPRG